MNDIKKQLTSIGDKEFNTRRKEACYLFLYKNYFIIEYEGENLLNQRNDLFSHCRHQNKFKLLT